MAINMGRDVMACGWSRTRVALMNWLIVHRHTRALRDVWAVPRMQDSDVHSSPAIAVNSNAPSVADHLLLYTANMKTSNFNSCPRNMNDSIQSLRAKLKRISLTTGLRRFTNSALQI